VDVTGAVRRRCSSPALAAQRGEEIGRKIYAAPGQFFRIEDDEGRLVIDGATNRIGAGDGIVVPAGARPCGNHANRKVATFCAVLWLSFTLR